MDMDFLSLQQQPVPVTEVDITNYLIGNTIKRVSMIYINIIFLFLCPVSIAGEQFVTALRSDKTTKGLGFKADILTQYLYSNEMQIIGGKKLKRKGDGYAGI